MNHSSRILYLAMAAVVLTTVSWSARATPHGEPVTMARPQVRFGRVPAKAGVLEPVHLTTALAETPAIIRAHLSDSPPVPLQVRELTPHQFLIMPRIFWPKKSHVTLRWSGSSAARTITTNDDREVHIDLSTQTPTATENCKVVRTMTVSTGVAPRWVTPTGTFWIYRRVLDDHMVGGKPGTADHWDVEHVPYAQYFTGGVAIHGAWWNHHFGKPVSHGCVQLPTAAGPQGSTGDPADAEWLWQFADLGTPVIVTGDTPDGSQSAKAPLPYPASSPSPISARSSAS